MTKRDIVVKIAQKTGLIQNDVAIVVQKFLDGLADEIAAGHTVELRDFGVFKVKQLRSRVGRNPHQPEKEVLIPSRPGVKFSTGKSLKKRVFQLDTARILL